MSNNNETRICKICRKTSTKICACKAAKYCSIECQQNDWPEHKSFHKIIMNKVGIIVNKNPEWFFKFDPIWDRKDLFEILLSDETLFSQFFNQHIDSEKKGIDNVFLLMNKIITNDEFQETKFLGTLGGKSNLALYNEDKQLPQQKNSVHWSKCYIINFDREDQLKITCPEYVIFDSGNQADESYIMINEIFNFMGPSDMKITSCGIGEKECEYFPNSTIIVYNFSNHWIIYKEPIRISDSKNHEGLVVSAKIMIEMQKLGIFFIAMRKD